VIPVTRKIFKTVFILIFIFNISNANASGIINWKSYFSLLKKHYPNSKQLLIALPDKRKKHKTILYTLEKKNSEWRLVYPKIKAVNGYKGFAPPGKKSEGDGKSPSGIYRIGSAFGYYENWKTRLHYRPAGKKDIWIDDIRSKDYNKWVRYDPGNYSHEKMRRKDHLYRLGIIIKYNIDPVIKGKGSAIFIHLWRKPYSPTSGCLAISEQSIKELLSWLDKKKNPVIIMGHISELIENMTR
jgi:L,D-peptidoglycan transpeptidase YkuD (ErfK/YbiS/YcfS/YnhG family)